MTSVAFPADCRICGNPLSSLTRVPVCHSCWANLPSQSASLCSLCGENLGISDFGEVPGENLLCRPCRLARPAFERAVAHGVYQGTLRLLLHLLKYEGLEPVARRLGTLIAGQLAGIPGLPQRMLVIPVPLFKARRRERGFNQAELLARAAVRAMGSSCPEWEGEFAPGVLARQRATESQAGLSPHERRRNLRGAFFVSDPARVRGRDVLVIDDIYTTGATARACSQVLKRAGAATVWVATVARAQRRQIETFRPETVADVPMHQDVAMWDGGRILQ
ncbi:MAG TPA: ComF family protein [Silvibacterium sp.]|nr:ComF family protein [Silvibacterium sp.]